MTYHSVAPDAFESRERVRAFYLFAADGAFFGHVAFDPVMMHDLG